MSDVKRNKAKRELERAADMAAERETSAYARTVLQRLTDVVSRGQAPDTRA